jgi:DNA repair exonuclease SbcCD ATPase subunit
MTRYYLCEISIEGFRGINNEGDPLVIRLKPGAVNSVSAPNGVGKTSIFEAIHFAIFGTVPRLKKLQAAERPDAYVVNRFHPSGQAVVILTFEPDDGSPKVAIKVERARNGARAVISPAGQADPEAFLKNLREDFVLVDYAKFAEFIDASALERGRSFASLVGLSNYSGLRQALEGAADTRTLNSDFDIKKIEAEIAAREREMADASRRALSAYAEITGQPAADLNDVEALCATVSSALRGIEILKPVVGTFDVRRVDLAAAENVIERAEGGAARKRQAELQQSIADLDRLAPAGSEAEERRALTAASSDRDTALAKVGSPLLRELYERARAVVTDASWPDPKRCPVCDSTLTKGLDEHLEECIAQYAAADAANEAIEKAILGAASVARLEQLEAAAAISVPAAERRHAAIIRAARDHALATAEIGVAFARLDALEATRAEALAKARTELAELERTLPPSLVAVARTIANVKQFCDAIAAHEKATAALAERKRALALRERWRAFIGSAVQAFSTAETGLANARIAACEAEYQGLFGSLVRGGPDVRPTLQRASGSENIDLTLANFHGQSNVNARAVLSESYRNAVAASIFLAAATRYNGAPRFVILDDVTSSFDAGHQFSLMEAIRTKLQQPTNPDGSQFIILSHDTALEKYFDRQNGTTDWHHQKLQGMPPVGRVMISAQEADRLKVLAHAQLSAGQIDLGAPFLRQYLEYKLGYIISKLEIPCPPDYATRGDKRTLSTYIDAITDAVDLYQAANRCVLTPAQINDIKNTHVPSIVGNFVSHYETGAGTPFNAYALLGVLQAIDDLAGCFMWQDASITPPVKRYCRRLDRLR